MCRRDLLKAGIGAAAALAAPRIGGATAAKTLVVAPTADLVVLDPVVTFNRQTRNYAYLVFDTLCGLDTSWQAQPQMVEGHEVDDDGLIGCCACATGCATMTTSRCWRPMAIATSEFRARVSDRALPIAGVARSVAKVRRDPLSNVPEMS